MSADGLPLCEERPLVHGSSRFGLRTRELAAWGLTGLLVLAVAFASDRSGAPALFFPAALALLVGWVAWEDIRQLTIPDAALVGMAGLAVVDLISGAFFQFDPTAAASLFALDGLLCGGALFAVREFYFRRHSHDGIGFGDVKLAAVGGLLCGVGGFSMALLAASLAGLAAAAALALRQGADARRTPIAFGALLAPALCVAWILGVGR